MHLLRIHSLLVLSVIGIGCADERELLPEDIEDDEAAEEDDVDSHAPALPPGPTELDSDLEALGTYGLIMQHPSPASTRGWQIEWQVPSITANAGSNSAIGQWYYNLESGIYYLPGQGWRVFFYGDDNGLSTSLPSSCNVMWGGVGALCFAPLAPGQRVKFKYDWCLSTSTTSSLSGAHACLRVDLNDGAGWRYLAKDNRTTVEIYTHDIESFEDQGQAVMGISCSTPVRMHGTSYKNTSGSWVTLQSGDFGLMDATPYYSYQNMTAYTWEACNQAPSCTPCLAGESETQLIPCC